MTEIALKAEATVVVISTGGILSGLAELHYNCYYIPSIGGQPPRSAFGHIFARQLALFAYRNIPEADDDEAQCFKGCKQLSTIMISLTTMTQM